MYFTYFFTDNKHIQPALEFATQKHVLQATCWSRIPTPQQFRWFRLIHSKSPQTNSKFDQDNQMLLPRWKFFLGPSKGLFWGAKRQTSCLRFQGVGRLEVFVTSTGRSFISGPGIPSCTENDVIVEWFGDGLHQKVPTNVCFGKSHTVYKCIIETCCINNIDRYPLGWYIDRLPFLILHEMVPENSPSESSAAVSKLALTLGII